MQYAEMELNGNVHLTGTQGVGKSTLLRAILFFYNADKTKLGIPREKQSFDEYYFPYQNSYILYEVMKEEVPYCVLAYKVNGKTAFRFIDSAYKRELFIDPDNRAFQSWDYIRKALGKDIYYTPIISGYNEFRQIIYGDNKALKPEYRKYALLETKQYQNLPLTIQNVFLNTNLEAKFIKDTIIKSLNEKEFEIDLENYLRNHLRGFESQINDITIWFKKNKKGQIPIRNKADNIIDLYRKTNYLAREKHTLVTALSGRADYIDQEKPKLNATFQREDLNLEKLNKERNNLKELHLKREQKLISDINLLRERLREAKEKQDEYIIKNIEVISERVAKKSRWTTRKNLLEEEKASLTIAFADINVRFKNLNDQINNRLVKLKNEKNTEIITLIQKLAAEKEALILSYKKAIEQVKKDEQGQLEKWENEKKNITRKENQLHNENAELKHKRFFEEEIIQSQKEKEALQQNIAKWQNEIEKSKDKKSILRREGELEIEKLDQINDVEKQKVLSEQEKYLSEIENIQHKIKQSESSLYGWLHKNVPNWEQTIGKVIDEEEVLFHTDLNPSLTDGKNQSFFGVNLNLNALKNRVKTVDEYRENIQYLEKELEKSRKKLSQLEEQQSIDSTRIKKRINKKLGSFDDVISEKEYWISRDTNRLNENKLALDEWEKKAIEEKENKLKEIEEQLEKTASEKLKITEELARIKRSIQRQISLKNTEREKKIAELESEKEKQVQKLHTFFEEEKTVAERRLQELKKQESEALAEKGVDTDRIQKIDAELAQVQKELNFISVNEALVIEYNKDKREVFDKVPEWKAERKQKESERDTITEVHRKEQQKADKKYAEQKDLVKSIAAQLEQFTKDEEELEDFKLSQIYLDVKEFFIAEETSSSTLDTAVKLIKEVTEKYYEEIRTLDSLKTAINDFTGNFNEDNIFRFKVFLNTNKEFINFAVELKEFIEADKIKEYEVRVNERFAHIIQLIGKETNELLSKEAEIEKVIRKINTDFETKNFVEAIKEMEMRTQKSSNPIVRLLSRISDFNEESNLTLGAMNLFNISGNTAENQKAVNLLKQLIKELERSKNKTLSLSESFDLQFRIVENDNDSGWVEKLSNVGSEGTDVLVKAMINIMLLNVFKADASKRFKNFKLHCMMDEIGRLHPTNVKGILRFANERDIFLINGSPISQSATDYKYTYKLSKHKSPTDSKKYYTKVNRLVKVKTNVLSR